MHCKGIEGGFKFSRAIKKKLEKRGGRGWRDCAKTMGRRSE